MPVINLPYGNIRWLMQISSASEFGQIVKKVRKKLNLTQAELAGASGTGTRFVIDLEHGKPTCEFEKVLHVAQMLGMKIEVTELPFPLRELDS